jgi:hypothetical protein
MAFPQSILDTRVEVLLGSTWTNITSYVYQRDKVTITGGHPDEATRANPTTASLTVDNRTGRFSPRNPLGAYYGSIGRNTPLRISVPEQATYLRSETDQVSYATCPTSAGLGITGDLEVQIDATLDNWYGEVMLCAKYNSTVNQRSWELLVLSDGTLDFAWSTDGTLANRHAAVSTASIAPTAPLGRLAIKATLSVATGTVTFYTAPTIAGSWTQLGSPVVVGATSVFASTAPVTVGYDALTTEPLLGSAFVGFQGKIHGFKLLSGIGGTAKASPDFTAQSDGATTFNDAQGNVWTLGGTAEISGRKYRAHGEVTAWPPRWDKTGNDVYAPIQAAGLLRRLGAPGAKALNSPLYRAYVRATGTSVPLAYWPCEDGANATSIASGIGGTPLAFTGTPTLAGNTSFACSQPIASMSGSTWTGVPPPYSGGTPTVNSLKFLMAVPAAGGVNNNVIARMYTTGTVSRLDLIYTTGGFLTLTGYNSSGNQLFTTGATAALVDGKLLLMAVLLVTNGSGVDYDVQFLSLPGGGEAAFGGTQASASVGQVTKIVINPAAAADSTAFGHVSVGIANDIQSYGSAFTAWSGELAATRFTRLCTEEGIASRVNGNPNNTAAMGIQTAQTLLALLQECEDADRGLIYEPRHVLALGYRTRTSLYNQPAAVALSYTAAQLAGDLLPNDDDQLTLNDVTVNRANGGSSVRQVLTTGALSIQAPPNGVGPYPTSPPINLAGDSQLADEAGWILHVGTADEPRYPGITVDLTRAQVSGVYYQAQDAFVGDRVTVANTPTFLPPDGISQLVRGFTEVCFGYTFTVTWQCAPESPYRVAVLDDAVLGHADTDGSAVHANIASGAASMQVDTTTAGSPLWTTTAGDFPFDIAVGGERMTVTNITGASSPQTFTVTRSVNGVVKAQSAGTDVRLFQPMILSL